MAKVVNGGNKKGKVGSSIFYTIKNSNNKVTQGERIYQPNVTNPQSESQRAQRMKMTPASNFYRALSGILDHSWEGVKYGAMSRQFFLQLAMGKTQDVFPYLLKGENMFVPGPYPVSRGSLSSIDWKLGNGLIVLTCSTTNSDDTWGFYSRNLIRANSFLHDGDQLTFIVVYELQDREQRTFVPIITRVLLDSQSEVNAEELFGNGWTFDNVGTTELGISYAGFSGSALMAGGCVIVSRKNVSGGQVWQRSTERMAVTERVYNMYMSPDAYTDALESYKRTAASYDSDYYLNDAETPEEVRGIENYSFTNGSVDFTLGGTTKTHAAVVVQNDNGPLLTCAKFGVYEDETPTGDTAWIETYIVRGRTIVLMDRYNLQATNPQSITAAYEGKTIQVLTPEAFVARFKDFSIA